MNTLTLSASSLDKAGCLYRYWLYRHAGGKGYVQAQVSAALAQGIAGHGASALHYKGQSVAEQEGFVDRVFAQHPTPVDDYRTAAYLKEALAQYRADFVASDWRWEAVEVEFELELGTVFVERVEESGAQRGMTRETLSCAVRLNGRLDRVGLHLPTGQRYLFDDKWTSQDRSADVTAAANSRQLKLYWWAWAQLYPDKPLNGIYQKRNVVRKPTKVRAVNVDFPQDPPVRFSPEVIEEWKRNTLARARAILERDPADPTQWHMEESLCKGPYGCCEYIGVCTLPPGDRLLKLAGNEFRPAGERYDYEKDTET